MADISDLRKGVVVKHQNDLYLVTGTEFVNPGKGAAFCRTKMKSITSSKTTEITYKTSESVEIVDVERQQVQYLYRNGEMFSFMNQQSYEMFDMNADDLGEDGKFLKDGIICDAILYNERVVAIEIPKKIQYVVKEAPPAIKGDTASGRVLKDAIMENGLMVRVPAFINEGETIMVNTQTGEYSERVNG